MVRMICLPRAWPADEEEGVCDIAMLGRCLIDNMHPVCHSIVSRWGSIETVVQVIAHRVECLACQYQCDAARRT